MIGVYLLTLIFGLVLYIHFIQNILTEVLFWGKNTCSFTIWSWSGQLFSFHIHLWTVLVGIGLCQHIYQCFL